MEWDLIEEQHAEAWEEVAREQFVANNAALLAENAEFKKAELLQNAVSNREGVLGLEDKMELEPCLMNATNECGRTPLHLLFENRHLMDSKDEGCLLRNLKLMCRKGAKVNTLDIYITSALLLAVRNNKIQAVKMLIGDFGANQNLADLEGRTPLYTTCEFGFVEIAQFLIVEPIGTQMDRVIRRKETSLMRCAVMPGKNWLRIAELMIENVEPEGRMDFVNQTGDASFLGFTGKTALHWATEVNNAPMIELLVRHGANREATDIQGRTPLFLAVQMGQYYSAQALLRLHADRFKSDFTDSYIAELLLKPGFEPIAKLFRQIPEQSRRHHHYRPILFPNTASNLGQRSADAGDDGGVLARKPCSSEAMMVETGTKNQRAVTKRNSVATEEHHMTDGERYHHYRRHLVRKTWVPPVLKCTPKDL